MTKVGLSVTTSIYADETSSMCTYTCPDSHFLESWNDANPTEGKYSLAQPVISNLYDTRQVQESLMAWSDQSGSYVDFIKEHWSSNIATDALLFSSFWNKHVVF